MNETEKAKAALAGIGGNEGNGGIDGAAGDSPQTAGQDAELEKLRHTADVWAGRAKKAQEEKKALEEKLRKYESGQAVDEALRTLSPEDKKDTPDDYLGASGMVAAKIVGDAQAATNAEIEKLRREIAERDENAFLAAIAAKHADLFDSVQPGGDKHDYWNRYREIHRETFDSVMATHDVARFDSLVNGFFRELGIPVSGAGASASPTPGTTGGPSPAGLPSDTRTISSDEYLRELDRAEELRKAGDMKGWREVNDRLKAALNEGRVK